MKQRGRQVRPVDKLMRNRKKGIPINRIQRDHVTLAAILAALQPEDHVFVIHRLGPHEYESAAEGTVQELQAAHCIEVCGDNVVERLALEADEYPNATTPTFVITIGGKIRG